MTNDQTLYREVGFLLGKLKQEHNNVSKAISIFESIAEGQPILVTPRPKKQLDETVATRKRERR